MKIKKHKYDGGGYISFKGKFISGEIWSEGSGYLQTKSGKVWGYADYLREDGKHIDRVNDIKYLRDFYAKAYKELKVLDRKRRNIKLKRK